MTEAYSTADIGRAVRARRHEIGWTQAELAEWLGVSRRTVISLEQGGPVSVEIVMRALTILGTKVLIVPKGSAQGDPVDG